MKLLFCDTFSQEPSDGSVLNSWAAIDFLCPVVLEEIRIIPHGLQVHEQLSSDGQIGKTVPGQFRIDFFASDSNNNTGSTFENLCTLEYQESMQTTVLPPLPLVTDKLVCSGWYKSLTLAVFGAEASDGVAVKAIRERRELPKARSRVLLPTPDQLANANADVPTSSGNINKDALLPPQRFTQRILSPSSIQSNHPPYHEIDTHNYQDRNQDEMSFQNNQNDFINKRGHALLPTPGLNDQHQSNPGNQQGRGRVGRGHFQYNRFGRNSNQYPEGPEWTGRQRRSSQRDDMDQDMEENLEFGNEDSSNTEWEEYDVISDEDILDEEAVATMEALVVEDMLLPASMMSFNPFEMVPYPLAYFKSPDTSEFESLHLKLIGQLSIDVGDDSDDKAMQELAKESATLKNMMDKAMGFCSPLGESDQVVEIICGKETDWLSCIENILPKLKAPLVHLEATISDDIDYLSYLVVWAVFCLKLDSPFTMLIGINVRAIKSGLNLALSLCRTTLETVEQLIQAGLTECLLAILEADHFASSVKISAVHVLDAITDWPTLMHLFILGDEVANLENGVSKPRTSYIQLVQLALKPQAARMATALTQLIRKAHMYECMDQVKSLTMSIVDKMPPEYAYNSDDENEEDIFTHEDEVEAMEIPAEVEHSEEVPQPESPATTKNTSLGDHDNLRIVQNECGQRKVFGELDSSDPANSKLDVAVHHEVNEVPVENIFNPKDICISVEESLQIAKSLLEITAVFKNPGNSIGQLSVRTFPVSKNVTGGGCVSADVGIYRMSEFTGLLSSVQVLLTLPYVSGHKPIFDACYGLLEQLMSTHKSLLYLTANSDTVIIIIQHLLQSSPNLEIDLPGTAGHLGAKLAFLIQSMQSVDHISCLLESEGDVEDIEDELVHTLKTLFSITYLPLGKHCLSQVLSMDRHLLPILSCLCYPRRINDLQDNVPVPDKTKSLDNKEEDGKITEPETKSKPGSDTDGKDTDKPQVVHHRTAVNHYASGLLLTTLVKSESVAYIYENLNELKKACLTTSHVIPKSELVMDWLHCLKNVSLKNDQSDIPALLLTISTESEQLSWNSFPTIGPQICTSLRLLRHVCKIGSNATDSSDSRLQVMRLFSCDALGTCTSLLEKLHDALYQVCHGLRALTVGVPLRLYTTVTSCALNCLQLVRSMLSQLLEADIDSKCVNGKRLAAAVVFLYSDLYLLTRPVDPYLLHDATGLVVAVLALFFAHKSCFDQAGDVFSEILKCAESRCDNFQPMLTLLSQLLPLPLPIITPPEAPQPAAAEASVAATCAMWSGCLLPHVDRIMSLLLPLSASVCQPLLNVCTIFAQQIVDLSPAIALEVVRKYAEEIAPLLVVTGDDENEAKAADDSVENVSEKELMLSPEQITTVANFAEVVTLPSAKATLVYLLYSDGDGILDLWRHASTDVCDSEAVAAILLLASVVVDTGISMLPVGDDAKSMANCFPSTIHLRQIVTLAWNQIANPSPSVSSRALLVILRLLDERSALPFLRNGLSKNEGRLLKCLQNAGEKFDDEEAESIDVALNLVEVLVSLVEPERDAVPDVDCSKPCFTLEQLSALLEWNYNPRHPLRLFEAKLSLLSCWDDPGYDHTIDKLSALRQSLVTGAAPIEIAVTQESDFPAPVPLADQFTARPLFCIGLDDPLLLHRLTLTAPKPTVTTSPLFASSQRKMVQCDLVATAEKFCPGYDLAEQLDKLAKETDFPCELDDSRARRQPRAETFTSRAAVKVTYIKRSHGLLTQPRPGRGRGRGSVHNRPFDLFRHRKQNTSRPPSMHVDDFMAADEEQIKQQNQDGTVFKSPQLPSAQPPAVRRTLSQPFKRDYTPKGRGGRGGRGGGSRMQRGGGGGFVNNMPQGKFTKPKLGAQMRGRSQERYRGNGNGGNRLTSRLSFSPREGYKTNKTLSPSWTAANRNMGPGLGGQQQFRGRGGPKFNNRPFVPRGGKQWNSPFPRRGRGFGKPRGKHLRSSTR